MRRNKRCLLAYHRQRTEKVQELVWKGVDLLEESGSAAAGGSGGSGAAAGMEGDDGSGEKGAGNTSLSPEEEEYARGYSELLAAYKGRWTDVDLTGSLEPPKDLFVDVRVLKDAGEIQTEYG
jgi:GINS complex subunit 1